MAMIDFFDEDFPLTKAQEEELARQAERAAAALEEDREAMNAVAEHELESLSDRTIREERQSREEAKKAEQASHAEEPAAGAGQAGEESEEQSNIEAPKETGADTSENPPKESVKEPETGSACESESVSDNADETMESAEKEVVSLDEEAAYEESSDASAGADAVGEESAEPNAAPTKADEKAEHPARESYNRYEPEPAVLQSGPITDSETGETVYEFESTAARQPEQGAPVDEINLSEQEKSSENLQTSRMNTPDAPIDGFSLDERHAQVKDMEAEDAALRAELEEIVEKLDNMEKAVSAMETAKSDESDDTGFSYEYDDRYYAEEETPAYKYPQLHTHREPQQTSRKREDTRQTNSTINLSLNKKTLLKVGAVVAATAAAIKLLGKKDER